MKIEVPRLHHIHDIVYPLLDIIQKRYTRVLQNISRSVAISQKRAKIIRVERERRIAALVAEKRRREGSFGPISHSIIDTVDGDRSDASDIIAFHNFELPRELPINSLTLQETSNFPTRIKRVSGSAQRELRSFVARRRPPFRKENILGSSTRLAGRLSVGEEGGEKFRVTFSQKNYYHHHHHHLSFSFSLPALAVKSLYCCRRCYYYYYCYCYFS